MEITKKQVLEISERSTPAQRDVLMKWFPEAFIPEYHDFGDSLKLGTVSKPLFIRKGFEKADDTDRILFVHKLYEVEVLEGYEAHKGSVYTALKFKIK